MTDTASIDTLAARVAERLAALGLTERQASLMATGRPDALRYIRTRKSMPSMERMLRIAKVLEVDPSYLWGETNENDWEAVKDALDVAVAMNADALRDLGGLEDGDSSAPCLNSTQGPLQRFPNVDGTGDIEVQTTLTFGEIVHILRVPPAIKDRRLMGYQVIGDEMSPLYSSGDFVLIETDRGGALKEVVLVDLGQAKGGRASFLAILNGRTKTALSFRQLGAGVSFQVPIRVVADLHRVVPYGELITA